jgi:hypothetical protein
MTISTICVQGVLHYPPDATTTFTYHVTSTTTKHHVPTPKLTTTKLKTTKLPITHATTPTLQMPKKLFHY